jgi:hypothetical protein
VVRQARGQGGAQLYHCWQDLAGMGNQIGDETRLACELARYNHSLGNAINGGELGLDLSGFDSEITNPAGRPFRGSRVYRRPATGLDPPSDTCVTQAAQAAMKRSAVKPGRPR